MEGLNINNNQQEKGYDSFLEDLWIEYDFHGNPPFESSVAEERLKEVCDMYAGLIDRDENKLSGLEVTASDTKKILSSDSHRRELHNKIAIMVVGKQRSGMDDILARKIANFAYEYSRGYKIGEKDKYKN